VTRTDGSGSVLCCVKVPHNAAFSLCPEAIIQWITSDILIRAGIHGAVPPVYDIFQYAGETRFSMKFIKGVRSIEWILQSDNPEETLIQILAQVIFIMGYLEEQIHLDHRDLKGDNIWIHTVPIDYTLTIGGRPWRIRSPFQVVILDFGFSCLGASDGNAIVSLSDGILPEIDPCPKQGRDLFQLIASLWSIPEIRSKMGSSIQTDIEQLLSYKNKPYAALVKKSSQTHWIYLLVSDPHFQYSLLHPLSLLRAFSIKYEFVYITSV